jgi:hypothetical protein
MTTSSLDTFSSTRDELISDALVNCGALGPGKDADGRMRDHAARVLNRIVKALDADGVYLWRNTPLTFATTASTATYTLDATALAVDDPVSYLQVSTTTRTPIKPMSRDEYAALSDRTITSRIPSRYYIAKTLTGAGRELLTMTLWPEPSTSSDTVEYTAQIRGKDYTTGADTSDFPSSWVLYLTYALSAALAPGYKRLDAAQYYEQIAAVEKSRQLNNDNEHMSIQLVPWGGY